MLLIYNLLDNTMLDVAILIVSGKEDKIKLFDGESNYYGDG